MGGQACVFYGAAEFSKDVDLAILAEPENFRRLQAALTELEARRIAVPRFEAAALARGHAVHFRCQAEATRLQADRHLFAQAHAGDLETLRSALDAEVRVEQAKDRAYWEPMRRELEVFRRKEMINREIRTD